MKRQEKQQVADALRQKFVRSNLAVVAEFSGMSVPELQEVKRRLRMAGGEFKVVKKTLAIRAADGTCVSPIRAHFKGQTAVALGYGDPAESAKALKQLTETQKKLKIRAGVMEGRVIGLADLVQIADLPSRPVLYAHLIGRMRSPIVHFASGLQGLLGKWVRALAAVHEKRSASS